MATTVNSDMIIYNRLAETAYLERLQDNLNVFNQASNGAIVYKNELIKGDFDLETFYKIGGSIAHRDVNSQEGVSGKKIGMGETAGVKTPYKYGPYESTEEAFKRRARSTAEFAQLVGQDLADALMVGRLQYGLASVKAAISGNADMVATGTIAVDGRKALTKAMRPMGDKFGRIALWVMNSDTYFDLVDEALTNQIYGESEIVVYGGLPGTMGKPVLVTDLVGDNDAFGLQAGAVTITESQVPGFRLYDINDQENLGVGARAEGAFNIDLLGYSWDTTKGENPTLAELGASANWKKHASSNKMTAGTYLNLAAQSGG
ncbi:phage capsid protein [Acinetobacter sp. YIM 103518]|uniref:Phage capsid protein n=1 Tax=Acinetobacter faecalis TaxID=2665161 RepID=A0A6L6GB46_9GAMM|nr:major capsid protein [Acinetobacter faecalis]MTD09893.1 phage capsid protein [Acinetobacter faecalis]